MRFQIDKSCENSRLDRALAQLCPEYSRSFWQRMIADGRIRYDGKVAEQAKLQVYEGMEIEIDLPAIPQAVLPPEEPFEFPILYEDEEFLIIDKPAGVVVHPAAGVSSGTVVNALLGRYPELKLALSEENLRPGVVHRLDKDTSGCLVCAKNVRSQAKLSGLFAERKVKKIYLAMLFGHFKEERGELANFIGRHPVDRQKMALTDGRRGKSALSKYRVLKSGFLGKIPVSLVQIELFTGRTHQIRVQMAGINHPVIGDLTYGNLRVMLPDVARQMLHAWKLVIGEVAVTAPLPEDLASLADNMREERE